MTRRQVILLLVLAGLCLSTIIILRTDPSFALSGFSHGGRNSVACTKAPNRSISSTQVWNSPEREIVPTSDPVADNLGRAIRGGIVELRNFFRGKLLQIDELASSRPDIRKIVQDAVDDGKIQLRSILEDVANLSKVNSNDVWRARKAKHISDLVQRRLYHIQNPRDCRTARKIVCNFQVTCGVGCQLHHVVYCLVMAYVTQRTLILDSKRWEYSPKGWEAVFLPLSDTCVDNKGNTSASWTGQQAIPESAQVLYITTNHRLKSRPAYLPPAVPEDLLESIVHFHGDPDVWWIGQIIEYATRLNPAMAKMKESVKNTSDFRHPIVGVHVRRTDKLVDEARLFEISEYMVYVDEYYQMLERTQRVDRRRVYLATDDPNVITEARTRYPQYVFIHLNGSVTSPGKRNSERGLQSIALDIHLLSESDFLVCTFSSNIGRATYEFMQAHNTDASAAYVSLDHAYFYTGPNNPQFTAIYEHKPRNKDEIALSPGDVVKGGYNHFDGYSSGRNVRLSTKGRYPTYKVKRVILVAKMPTYKEVPLEVNSL